MKITLGLYALGLSAITVSLAGCSGVVLAPTNASHFAGALMESHVSSRAASAGSLLYISEEQAGEVVLYEYRDGTVSQLYETLTGFRDPTGMCADKAGDVWITDRTLGTIFKYRHGETTPIEKIHEGLHERPSDCAIDPTTGNLAVSSHESFHGVVRIYQPNAHRGTAYKLDGGPDVPDSLAYDDAGNLFVVGFQGNLYKLSRGGSSLVRMTLSGGVLQGPSGIQWINPNLMVATQTPQGAAGYRVSVSGYDATVVGSIPFQNTSELTTFGRRAGYVIVPDDNDNIIRIYRLSDGSLVSSLSNQIFNPFGAVVSQAGIRH